MKIKMTFCLAVLATASACGMKHKRSDDRFGANEPGAHAAHHVTAPMVQHAGDAMAAEQARAVAAATTGTPAADHSAHATPHAKEIHPGVPAATALRWLTNGNNRYTKAAWRKDGAAKKDIVRLSTGQHPHAIVVSCSDSRVPPEIVFDQKLGEIFTVRTAGQSLDHNAIGSIEYAVEHLGSRLIVVMGHTSCGTVKAAHDTLGGASAGTPSLDALVKDIHPRIAAFKGHAPTAGVEKESWANAEGVANDLIARSNLLNEKWNKGQIMVVPALYDLKTGRVAYHEALKNQAPRTPASHH